MEECKLLLKKYKNLQKKYKKNLLKYTSFLHKGFCREDAMCDINIYKKIKIKLNKSDNYYNKKKIYIHNYINFIKRKNKYLLDAISRSYN